MNWHNFILAFLIAAAGCGEQASKDIRDTTGNVAETSLPSGHEALQQQVELAIEELNTMRSSLASTITTDSPDQSIFDAVCKPVGQRARSISMENGWMIRQMADRYRNPDHNLDEAGRRAFNRFEADSSINSFWTRTDGDRAGYTYYRRITVEKTCLACHGEKDSRPEFIVASYPDDRAFGFEEGDLRGLFAVFLSDSLLQVSQQE